MSSEKTTYDVPRLLRPGDTALYTQAAPKFGIVVKVLAEGPGETAAKAAGDAYAAEVRRMNEENMSHGYKGYPQQDDPEAWRYFAAETVRAGGALVMLIVPVVRGASSPVIEIDREVARLRTQKKIASYPLRV